MSRLHVVSSAAVVGVLVLGGCSAQEPDASHEGQVEYGCALAGAVDDELLQDLGPPETHDHLHRQLMAVGFLLDGALVPASADGQDGDRRLVDPALADAGRYVHAALERAHVTLVRTGVDAVREHCPDGLTSADVDVSPTGQLDYACALADHVRSEHGELTSWTSDATFDPRPWSELLSTTALLGVYDNRRETGAGDFEESARAVREGFLAMDLERAEDGLTDVLQRCADRG